MSANMKLVGTIKGRTIESASDDIAALLIQFDDGSTLKVKGGRDA
jgi:hypothetical protein